ncbi:presqualene diphosphate synthase HpnD [beta proteobacterium MWH-UniP1]
MTPDQYCESKVSESGSNLVAAFKILPAAPRTAITALYAFCREVDDVVDECSEPQLAAIKLSWWKTELDRLFEGDPTHPVTKALLPRLSQFNLPRDPFDEIVAGCAMDLNQNRYMSWADLDLYCDRVAGAVGLLSVRIFAKNGQISQATLDYAIALGRALQYTNIMRDVGDDARKGRIYLPLEAMQAHGLEAASILRFEHTPALESLLRDMHQRADALYQQAFAALPGNERSAQRPGLIMAAIYRELLTLVASESYQVLNQRISVAPARKLWLAWRASLGLLPT